MWQVREAESAGPTLTLYPARCFPVAMQSALKYGRKSHNMVLLKVEDLVGLQCHPVWAGLLRQKTHFCGGHAQLCRQTADRGWSCGGTASLERSDNISISAFVLPTAKYQHSCQYFMKMCSECIDLLKVREVKYLTNFKIKKPHNHIIK